MEFVRNMEMVDAVYDVGMLSVMYHPHLAFLSDSVALFQADGTVSVFV